MVAESLAGLVFLPLVAACFVAVGPRRLRPACVALGLLPLPLLLWPVTLEVWREGAFAMAIGGFERPLGIVWRVDALALLMLWLNAVITIVAGAQAAHAFKPASAVGRRFWSLWLLLACGMNALLLSADLFNLFVTLELVTLAAIGLLVIEGKPEALRAAVRYLILALLGSLLYLLGVALVYGQAGSLDLYHVGELLDGGLLPVTALVLMTVGLLIKAAIFPLHGWLPAAHGNAVGPVSAILSAMVVKVSLYLVWRLWFWMAADWSPGWATTLLGMLGAGAILYGSTLAFLQVRLKMMVAYSTVAQLGYLMLLFPLGPLGFSAASYHLVSHGLAKAAMFLAAANMLKVMGSDRLDKLAGGDRRLPLDTFTLAIAGVSILGLPPSGGFAAKWLMLQAAWEQGGWGWVVVILAGGLLAAAYLFRALAAICARPAGAVPTGSELARSASLPGLALALSAMVIGFVPAPVLEFLGRSLPAAFTP
jgi:multicomponent Na+:H+ antiporter subunit D